MTVTELVGDNATVVMAATGAGFHAAVGDLEHAHLRADHGIVRPSQSDPLTQYQQCLCNTLLTVNAEGAYGIL